jgi:hypothetical protein
MKLRTTVVLQLAALLLALGASALAATDGYLYVVHGIPGRDVAATDNPGLPVDVSVSGECLLHGLAFSSTAGPYTLAAGTYDVQVSLANTLAPCTNAALVTSQATVAAEANATVVAAISGGEPALLEFVDDLAPVATGSARFIFVNSADAPTLKATLTQLDVKNPQTFSVTANAGAETAITVPAGYYQVQVVASGSTTVLTSEDITFDSQSAIFTYAVGEASNNSVGLINRTIRDVF